MEIHQQFLSSKLLCSDLRFGAKLPETIYIHSIHFLISHFLSTHSDSDLTFTSLLEVLLLGHQRLNCQVQLLLFSSHPVVFPLVAFACLSLLKIALRAAFYYSFLVCSWWLFFLNPFPVCSFVFRMMFLILSSYS